MTDSILILRRTQFWRSVVTCVDRKTSREGQQLPLSAAAAAAAAAAAGAAASSSGQTVCDRMTVVSRRKRSNPLRIAKEKRNYLMKESERALKLYARDGDACGY